MNLFKQQRSPANPEQTQRIKTWVYACLNVSADSPIAISQLQCHEPGCPPIETVIAVMTQPPQTFKIHAAASEISQADVQGAIAKCSSQTLQE